MVVIFTANLYPVCQAIRDTKSWRYRRVNASRCVCHELKSSYYNRFIALSIPILTLMKKVSPHLVEQTPIDEFFQT